MRSFPKPVQRPGPPIYLGGDARNVFKRTVAYGDGWMPTRATPEAIRQGRDTLNELAAEAGRDPGSIQVLAYGMPADRELLRAIEEAGADEAVVAVAATPEDRALAELEQIAQKVLS